MNVNKLRYLFILMISVLLFSQCDEDKDIIEDNPTVEMDVSKTYGHGQYALNVESGNNLKVNVKIASNSILKSFKIEKTKNLNVDQTFGDKGVLSVFESSAEKNYSYDFNYTPNVDDVDELIGFTFIVENADGNVTESDLTLKVTLSPRDNLPRRRWVYKSKIWVTDPDNPNSEQLADCEKDNAMLLGEDGSISIDYGTDTGAGDCLFDGFNVYTNWSLSEDETIFTRTYYGIFSPDNVVTEVFDVKTLTVEKLELEQVLDLSAFGLGTEEKYLFVYEAVPL